MRQLPQAGRLLASAPLRELAERFSLAEVTAALRAELASLRQRARGGALAVDELTAQAIAERLAAQLSERARPFYRRVINATGVVLHTNLGRAPLAEAAVAALAATAGGAQRLEMDLASGGRGGREEGVAALLCELTGAEAATVVNNNAAATLLILATLARGRRVLISRGELVEIGGSYRIPEVMAESGAVLAEVGATNRTHPADYRRALEAAAGEVAMILKVHPSNYRIVGFTAEVALAELVALGREHAVPVVHDLGSGCLVDLGAQGLPAEPWVGASLAAGADLVCFSGDKLLGGPQCGVILGRRELVERCRRQPLFRALRPGRLVYAALEATLRLYRAGEAAACRSVPALARLTASPADLEGRARRLARRLAGVAGLPCRVVACQSQAGSGSLPAEALPSFGVELALGGLPAAELAARLRQGEPAVVGRVQDERLLLDVRTVGEDEVGPLAARLRALAASLGAQAG